MNAAELLTTNSTLIQRNRAARVALAAAYNLQEAIVGQHEVTYSIVPFGTRYRCTIYIDTYPVEKNHFYYSRDAEAWVRNRCEKLREELGQPQQ